MELNVLNIQGAETGRKISFADDVFGIEPNDHAIYLDVKQHLANKRQGTHKSKERAEIHRTTKKLKRQKGTGGARAGSMKSPLFIGGGRVFGPKPRDYSFKLNKKLKEVARKSALSYKAKDNNITVVEDFKLDEIKTKNYSEILSSLKLDDKKTLVVIPQADKNIYLSARNIQDTKVVAANDLNTYDILYADNLVLAESAIKTIETILS